MYSSVSCFFWVSLYLVLHTYIVYPYLLKLLYKFSDRHNYSQFTTSNELPFLSVVVPVYNEELIIEKKIKTILETSYPIGKIEILIGSDASTDDSNEILKSLAEKEDCIQLVCFEKRLGKTGIINRLMDKAKGSVIVFTDANILFKKSTLINLVRNFKDESIGLIGGNILNYNLKKDGISLQEKEYTSMENRMKYREGELWGGVIGAFGGLFAIKKEDYKKIPSNSLVDDFFITLSVIEKGKKAIMALDAISYEDISNRGLEEFKRKKRIAVGNFQNLGWFKKMLWPPYKGVAFAFLSHKVLRWLGPFLLIIILFSNAYLAKSNLFYQFTMVSQLIFYTISLIEYIFRKLNIHFFGFRFVTHFIAMNAALFIGFWVYLFGKKKKIWQPTKRFQ